MYTTDQERLAAFETMLRSVEEEQERITLQMTKLKAQGKVKSATYRQLMGQKLTCHNMLSMYENYGLR